MHADPFAVLILSHVSDDVRYVSCQGGAARGFASGGEMVAGGGVVIPSVGTARTSTKFVTVANREGGVTWEEEFFFSRVAGDIAVRIVCIDKVRVVIRRPLRWTRCAGSAHWQGI